MLSRREFLHYAAMAAAWPTFLVEAFALGGTAALSAPILGRSRLRLRATSLSKDTHWGIFVQEVAVRSSKIVPLSLIACFEFGRQQDPAVYGEIVSAALPLVAEINETYRIAVYFFENAEVRLQPHSDSGLMANRFEAKYDDQGRTVSMKSSRWDHASLPNANVHEVSIAFEYTDSVQFGAKLR